MNIMYRVLIIIILIVVVTVATLFGAWSTILTVIGAISMVISMVISVAWALDAYVLSRPVIRPWLLTLLGKRSYRGLVLAAGMSRRWRASILHDKADYYSTLYWKEINKQLGSIGLRPLPKPHDNLGLHKSLAPLRNTAIMWLTFNKYLKSGIKDISIVASLNSPAQITILENISRWNTTQSTKISSIPVSGESEIATSAFEGLDSIRERESVIVSYSDIVWKKELLKKLLEEKDGDIVILVDTAWRNNYPKQRRLWHDESHAELVFGKEGKIIKIGEGINRLEKDSRIEKLEQAISNDDCIGEIVGLFKFTPKGRKVFCQQFSQIRKLGKSINVAEWLDYVPAVGSTPKMMQIPIDKALLGCLLEHLSRESGLRIKYVTVKGGWAEIDHWGDLCIAEERIQNGVNLID